MKSLVFSLFVSLVVLAGCSTIRPPQVSEKTFENMYLRGVFTWWEADENFRLKPVDKTLYVATAKLIADGQPYDFRFSDAEWTSEYSCGSFAADGQVLNMLDKQTAKCDATSGNFRFTPAETGSYSFFIDFADPQIPMVYVRQAD